ncbi:MAG TPA: chemotaxis protein CheB [Longimicrobiaceae bacterium]
MPPSTPVQVRDTALPVVEARDGDVLRPGRVYTAPADRHLPVNPDRSLSLTEGERVHFSRPSADVLFESLADSVGPLAVAVVLTGRGEDGAAGALVVRDRGGAVIAQDEATSREFGMPGSTARGASTVIVLPLERIAPRLVALLETLQTVPA